MKSRASLVAWAFAPELKHIGLDGGECTEVVVRPVREQNPISTSVGLVAQWELPTVVENSVLAVSGELLGWLSAHGLVGMPRFVAVHARQNLWIAAIDYGSMLPDFGGDPLSCGAGQRVLKYSERWGVIAPPERKERAAWALMWADGRPLRAKKRPITQAAVSARTA
jgi:hypothetical protein